MPIYEYRCNQCAGEFEKYLPSGSTAVVCPTCESARVTRRLSLLSVRTNAASAGAAAMPMQGGGGCCGGGCGCH
ncbi:MAG TPA: zinc ribbon domain-containing protein [Methylomirabilota bacterium]|jgi:putative FmdB family regulatory protein|nr:MAG: zinc ribbon domain-containing protein [Candidatus Rokubacteria bacterium]PYM71761.1 MAG: zinc ribbon domain-containing protein [Candidatus Rokubacteria bacterium]